ncbi:MAG: hypothetical protein LBK03_05775 [Bacteroidales bacterium]|nr:hypothetical protein [Bacteroidales bacterium]
MTVPSEDLFGADARAITIDWHNSTYTITSQSCKSATSYQIVLEISGRFSMRNTIVMSLGNPFPVIKIVLNGIILCAV